MKSLAFFFLSLLLSFPALAKLDCHYYQNEEMLPLLKKQQDGQTYFEKNDANGDFYLKAVEVNGKLNLLYIQNNYSLTYVSASWENNLPHVTYAPNFDPSVAQIKCFDPTHCEANRIPLVAQERNNTIYELKDPQNLFDVKATSPQNKYVEQIVVKDNWTGFLAIATATPEKVYIISLSPPGDLDGDSPGSLKVACIETKDRRPRVRGTRSYGNQRQYGQQY